MSKPAPPLADSFLDQVSRSHPDFQMQLACALGRNDNPDRLAHLRALTSRFPDEPTLCAAILEFDTERDVQLNRPEEESLTGPSSYNPRYPLSVITV